MATAELPDGLAARALAALGGAVALKTNSFEYIWVNDAFCQMIGTDREALVGRTDEQVAADRPGHPSHALVAPNVAPGSSEERYESIVDGDGRVRELLVSIAAFEFDGECQIVQTLHDVSEIAMANHRLVATTEDLVAESTALRAEAFRDPLTQLLNRRGFETALGAARTSGSTKGALVMIDLDDLKRVNDTAGHQAGDAAIQSVADSIRGAIRRGRDVAARLGGDEFVIALPGVRDEETRAIVKRIRTLIEGKTVDIAGGTLSPRVSMGVALWRSDGAGADSDEWLRIADEALYMAKRAGKDQTAFLVAETAGAR